MKVAAILLLLGIMATGCSEGAQTGMAGSSRPTLRTVTLPRTLPNWVFHRFRSRCHEVGCAWDGVAVEANGDILVGVGEAEECCYLYGLVRFDPRRSRWVRGGIVNPTYAGPCGGGCLPAMTSFVPVGRAVWMVDANSGSLYRGRFSKGWSSARIVVRTSGCASGSSCPPWRPTRPWGFVNALTPGPHGRVWVVGSTGSLCSATNAAISVCGRSIVGLAGGNSRHVRAIRASRSGTATDGTVGPGGSLWLLVPRYRRCSHGSCRQSALVRYDPVKRQLTRYMISARLWPDIGALAGFCCNDGWVYTEPSGAVWVVAVVNRGFRVIRLHHGSFSSRVVPFAGAVASSRPSMDRTGDLWICADRGPKVAIINLRTGRITKLRVRGTSLLEDMHGGMWYVKGDLSGWSTCY